MRPGMRVSPVLVVLVVLSVVPGLTSAEPRHRAKPKPTPAHAAPKAARRSSPVAVRYLGSDPIGPLAVVRDGKVNAPSRSACRSWGPVGSRWTELDAYGRPAGAVVVTRAERYDATNCDELTVRRTEGRAGAGVYVSAPPSSTSARAATSPFEASRVGETVREALERVVAPIQRTVTELESGAKKAPPPMLVFQDRRSGARFAVVGGRALVIARWDGSRWIVEHTEKPADKKATAGAYKARAVVDMTHDGQPSVVFHVREGDGEWFGDGTLVRTKDGRWHSVDAGIYGSTA